jgi:drug/metabolite transporter (DMT)-like permease
MTFDETAFRRPAARGVASALLAAVLFGISTPLVQHAGRGVGPFATAALLYGGAALVGLSLRRPLTREAAVRRSDLPRLTWMALFGAVIGPVALAWGLQHTSGTSASLMLALEALFTALLARAWYGEIMDHRVRTAMALLLAGGVVLIVDRGLTTASVQLAGLLAVFAATVAWGVDNTLSRALAERDPAQVVLAKAVLGAAATAALALATGEAVPSRSAAALIAIGATGYGLSLRLYLLAQRAFGAGRTGSVFAFAPFVGALLAIALGDRSLSLGMAFGGLLMLAGVALHLAESHSHEHAHDLLEHEHAHRHDDAHHDHAHDPMPQHAHSHRHVHRPLRHAHPHVPDVHHEHRH